MGIHGVDADDYLKQSNQKELYAQLKNADRTVFF